MTTTRLLRSVLAPVAAAAAASTVLALAPLAPAAADGVVLPPIGGTTAVPGADDQEASAAASAPDGRLRADCHDYPVRYAVQDGGGDWMLDLVVRDRSGEPVGRTTLHATEHPAKGWTSVSMCREAVEAGRFTVGGVLTERDGYEQTEHGVERTAFRLTR